MKWDFYAEAEYIADMKRIMTYRIMSLPAVIINEKPAVTGKVLKPDEVKELLRRKFEI